MNQRKKQRNSSPVRRRSRDPHHAREAGRYERPVASREFILETLKQRGVPVEEHELERLLDIAPQDREAFARAVTSKLMTFALGRGLEYYDMPVVRAIVADAERDGYSFESFVLGVAESVPFRMRGAPEPAGD